MCSLERKNRKKLKTAVKSFAEKEAVTIKEINITKEQLCALHWDKSTLLWGQGLTWLSTHVLTGESLRGFLFSENKYLAKFSHSYRSYRSFCNCGSRKGPGSIPHWQPNLAMSSTRSGFEGIKDEGYRSHEFFLHNFRAAVFFRVL